MRAAISKNIEYCSKENDYKEFGTLPDGQGTRRDITNITTSVREGRTIRSMIDSNEIYNSQQLRYAENLQKYYEVKRNWAPEVTWIYGESGSGKTRYAVEQCTDPWISGRDLRWFDGYDGQSDVIFDDFRKTHCAFTELLRMLDRYPYSVEIKGGSRQFLAKRIFITCPITPQEMYEGKTSEDIQQLLRRITYIKEINRQEVA